MGSTHTASVIVLEKCRVAPPPTTVPETSLSLTFFDIPHMISPPVQPLIFYTVPCSKSQFIETMVPNLKHTLSLSLQHYFSLAGTLLIPLNSNSTTDQPKPVIRYMDGDSVSLTIAESTQDFNHLTMDFQRNAGEFYPLLPRLSPLTINESEGMAKSSLLAIQVTLFPSVGLCIGMAFNHTLGDATCIVQFLNSWALVNKLGIYDPKLLPIPLYDRSVIKDLYGLEKIYLDQVWEIKPKEFDFFPSPDMVRATFILTRADILNLKKSALDKCPNLVHVSSFVVTCAYLWICLLKSRMVNMEDDEEFICFPIDCRARLDPPVPENYYGNCVMVCLTKKPRITTSQLTGEDGFVTAVGLIGKCIRERVENGEEILKGLENEFKEFNQMDVERFCMVAWSTKVNIYGVDFGWGKPKKSEMIHIDGMENIFSLSSCRDSEIGDLEIGMSLPKIRMDLFASIFANGLKNLY